MTEHRLAAQIVAMATMAQRAEEDNKEYLVVQLRYSVPGYHTSRQATGLHTMNADGKTEKPLQDLLGAGWKIEREFVVNKVEKLRLEDTIIYGEHGDQHRRECAGD